MIRFAARIVRDDEGWSVEFPDLDDCVSFADSFEEARENARLALSLHLEAARDPAWRVPGATVEANGRDLHWIRPQVYVGLPLLVRAARRARGLGRAELAARLRVPVERVEDLETPGRSDPGVLLLEKVADALGLDLDIDLLGRGEVP